MDCQEFEKFAEAYVDGEFDVVGEAEVNAHLDGCEACRGRVQELTSFRTLLRDSQPDFKAPAHLRASVHARLDGLHRSRRPPFFRMLAMAAASLAVAGFLFSALQHTDQGPETLATATVVTFPIVEASVDWHRRDLPIEVTGPDANVVTAWFRDKVDFPVRLPQFRGETSGGVLGGRLSHVNDENAAHVVYEVDGAKVSVLVFQVGDLRLLGPSDPDIYFDSSHGYNVAVFEDGNGVAYSVTTELPISQLAEMVRTVSFTE